MRLWEIVLAVIVGCVAAATPAASQESKAAAARAAFAKAAAVFQHPRCVNCHHRGVGPRQGEAGRPHAQAVKRGPEGKGQSAAQRCTSCHKASNTGGGAVPGAPDWRMPPPGVAGWDGLSAADICAALKDPARNSRLSVSQIADHIAKDALVAWAWRPGGRRAPPPMAYDAFIASLRIWSDGEGACPE